MVKKIHKLLVSVGVVVTIIIFSVVMVYLPADTMMSPVNQQLNALKSGDILQAYSSYTSADFRSGTSFKEFKRFVYRYPTLDNHESSVLKETYDKDMGMVNGKIFSNGGKENLIEYKLIKENGEWRINQITVKEIKNDNAGIFKNSDILKRIFKNQKDRYSINYPENWGKSVSAQGALVLNGKPGTLSFLSTVNIQTIFTKQFGGSFSNLNDFMDEIKRQAEKETSHAKFLKNGVIQFKQSDGTKLNGQYLLFTYDLQGKLYKQWQIVVLRNDGEVFYTWAYTSPAEQFDYDLPTAKAILKTWSIYEK